MKEIRDTYFKDFGDSVSYISGLPIPKGDDGVCRGIRFINCEFHPGCKVKFADCEFHDCYGIPQKV